MASQETRGGLLFRYQAVDRSGSSVSDTVQAADEATALRRLVADGLVVTRLDSAQVTRRSGGRRPLAFGDRVLVLRQLALMIKAGVPLLEALQTVQEGLASAVGRAQFDAVIVALRHGEPFGKAFHDHAPGFPFYVHALASVGEASGRLGEVMGDAAGQMDFEHRLQRDLMNALTYPLFLMCAGAGAIGFILVNIVPRFSTMLGEHMDRVPASSRLLLRLGNYVSQHVTVVGLGAAVLVVCGLTASRNPAVVAALYRVGRRAPIVGGLLKAREIALWARLTAFALKNGIELLTATALARNAMPAGDLKAGLQAFEADLKGGHAVDVALSRTTALTPMDLSLLRAGQRSGALAPMFAALADKYESELHDGLKRLMALLEPLAIGMIAMIVGAVALSLVMALTSIYETVY